MISAWAQGLGGLQQVRSYSAAEPLSLGMIRDRILLVLKLYDKVDVGKVNPSLLDGNLIFENPVSQKMWRQFF